MVDTNILVYAANKDSDYHEICIQHLEQWRQQASPWYLTWTVCYEFLRVTTHPKVLSQPFSSKQAMLFLESLLDSPTLSMLLPTARHGSVLKELLQELPNIRGNLVHDTHTAALMREHGIREIWTNDSDFYRFGFLSVRDPLQ